MKPINRRQLLERTLLLGMTSLMTPFLPTTAFANTVYQQLGPSSASYIQHYFKRMKKWYEKEFYDFKNLLPQEKKFILAWQGALEEWGLLLPQGQMFEHFQFSHQIRDNKVNSARLSIGRSRWTPELIPLINEVCRARGVPAPLRFSGAERFYGFGWDLQSGDFKVYHFHQSSSHVSDKNLKPLSEAHHEDLWLGPRLSALTYKSGTAVKKKLIIPLKDMDWRNINHDVPLDVFAAMKMVETDGQGKSLPDRWHFRLRSFFLGQANIHSHRALSMHSTEFDQLVDSIIYQSKDQFTTYYP